MWRTSTQASPAGAGAVGFANVVSSGVAVAAQIGHDGGVLPRGQMLTTVLRMGVLEAEAPAGRMSTWYVPGGSESGDVTVLNWKFGKVNWLFT